VYDGGTSGKAEESGEVPEEMEEKVSQREVTDAFRIAYISL
jgi:hypothetical protein